MRTGSEVFVISDRRFRRQPLENQQIEFRCVADQAGQQGVDCAAS
jgi:cold shock CspA family protein